MWAQNVTGSSASGRRRLLQAASQAATVYYDIASVPSAKAAAVTSLLGSSSTASALVATLVAAGAYQQIRVGFRVTDTIVACILSRTSTGPLASEHAHCQVRLLDACH